MPVGLDGNPDPIVTATRTAVLDCAVQHVLKRVSGRHRVCVAVDGRSGVGKSTFADELASGLDRVGLSTVRSTTDSFHRPRSERMRLGPTSADGYFTDSHQLDVIANELLAPFRAGHDQVLTAAFDEPSDTADCRTASLGPHPTVLIFDGLFLQRPELAGFWEVAIYLSADERLDRGWVEYLLSGLPDDPSGRATVLDDRLRTARWPRYRDGWSGYVNSIDPATHASMTIDNNDLSRPRIVDES